MKKLFAALVAWVALFKEAATEEKFWAEVRV